MVLGNSYPEDDSDSWMPGLILKSEIGKRTCMRAKEPSECVCVCVVVREKGYSGLSTQTRVSKNLGIRACIGIKGGVGVVHLPLTYGVSGSIPELGIIG